MKKITVLLILLSGLLFHNSIAQNAPTTSAPYIIDATAGSVNLPVLVDGFSDIGAFSLTLTYDPLVLTYQGVTPNAALDAGNLSVSSSAATGGRYKVTISYPFGTPSVSLGDGASLLTLDFAFTTLNELNHTTLEWLDNGASCEYRDYANVVLNDSPKAEYYIDGLVATQVAPVTSLPSSDYFITGPISIPIKVANFDQIGSVSLTFQYDPAVLTYEDSFTSPLAGVMVSDGPAGNGNNQIVIGWFGTPASLADNSTLISLDFTYSMGNSSLSWTDNGISCEYTDALFYTLYDLPTEDFYQSGEIIQKMAPIVKADTIDGYTGEMLIVPVTTWNFVNINSFMLTLDFIPAVLSFECATPIPVISGVFNAVVNPSDQLEINWLGSSELSIPDGSVLFYLAFTYAGGVTGVSWDNTGSTCEFTSGAGFTPLADEPTTSYYKDGMAQAGPEPAVWLGGVSTDWETAGNWQDNQLPDNLRDVLISETNNLGNWPIYVGNLTLGQTCKDIIIEGLSSLNVTNDLVIGPGRMLDVTDNGTIYVSGDWINNGLFNTGTGTVEFYGNKPGILPSDLHPGDFLSNYTYETFSSSYTTLGGGSAGPVGNDAHSDIAIGFGFNYLGNVYNQVRINTNGWLSFDQTGEDDFSGDNSRLFFDATPTTAIAPWWDDLLADGTAAITYSTEGSAPTRVLTIEWKDMLSYASAATARINFQVKLYETTNVIEFCYGSTTAGDHSPEEGASMGLKGIAGGAGDFIDASTGSTENVVTCNTSDVGWPSQNFRFSPPPNKDKEIFWKVLVNKPGSSTFNVNRNTHIMGTTP